MDRKIQGTPSSASKDTPREKFWELVGGFDFFDFILEKPATRPRDRRGKEQLVYPFVTGFPGSSRVSALAPRAIAQAAESGPRCQLRMPAAT